MNAWVRRKKKQGFTLVELMVSVAIFSLLMTMVVAVVMTAKSTYLTAEARIVSQQDLRRALGTMSRELAETNSVHMELPTPNEIIFQIPIRVTDGGPLDGKTVDDDGHIIWGARVSPSTDPDGIQDYAIQYVLIPNNDISNSNMLVRRVLDGFPTGNQVGTDIVVANFICTLEFAHIDYPPVYDDDDWDDGAKMVTICHIPPGNPTNYHTITVAKSAWKAHEDHGDYIGRCIGDDVLQPADDRTIVIAVSAVKNNKLDRNMIISTVFGVTMRN